MIRISGWLEIPAWDGKRALVDTAIALELGEDVLEELRETGDILMPEEIVAGVLGLIQDDSRAGAVMQITIQEGQEYVY